MNAITRRGLLGLLPALPFAGTFAPKANAQTYRIPVDAILSRLTEESRPSKLRSIYADNPHVQSLLAMRGKTVEWNNEDIVDFFSKTKESFVCQGRFFLPCNYTGWFPNGTEQIHFQDGFIHLDPKIGPASIRFADEAKEIQSYKFYEFGLMSPNAAIMELHRIFPKPNYPIEKESLRYSGPVKIHPSDGFGFDYIWRERYAKDPSSIGNYTLHRETIAGPVNSEDYKIISFDADGICWRINQAGFNGELGYCLLTNTWNYCHYGKPTKMETGLSLVDQHSDHIMWRGEMTSAREIHAELRQFYHDQIRKAIEHGQSYLHLKVS